MLRDPRLAVAAYVAPALATFALGTPARALARATAVLLVAVSLFECLHLETCNDATFVTSFWTALWLLWFVRGAGRADPAFAVHARALAQCVVGLMFLGGAVGKLTAEHWSGEAFYRLYFRDNDGWPYPLLRAELEPGTVRALATVFSRTAIGGEILMALCPLLPSRAALVVGGAAMLVMMSAWNFHLASVLASLFGLLVASELLGRAPARGAP